LIDFAFLYLKLKQVSFYLSNKERDK